MTNRQAVPEAIAANGLDNRKPGNGRLFLAWSICLVIAAIWNLPHTIAFRYLCLIVLGLLIAKLRPDWRVVAKPGRTVLVFLAYILIHAFMFSSDYHLIFRNYWSEWIKFVLLSILGAGAGLVLVTKVREDFLLILGSAFTIPLIIHLILFSYHSISVGRFELGYLGINDIHGDFAYAAMQATIFLFGFYLFQARRVRDQFLSLVLILICVLSPLLAASRGGVVFVLAIVLAFLPVYSYCQENNGIAPRKVTIAMSVVLPSVFLIATLASSYESERWFGSVTRLPIGLSGDPIAVNCKGVGELQRELKSQGRTIDDELSRAIDSVNAGDASRLMTARAGLQLLAQHPMGVDGSRRAYQIAIGQICDPAIKMAHTHDGWLDTALAIGIPGAMLLLLVLIGHAVIGFKAMRQEPTVRSLGAVLFVLAVTWIIRAFFDSTQRDQMLEMQAFPMALLAAMILKRQQDASLSLGNT